MKSTLITPNNKNTSYSYILDLLLRTLGCEITVVSVAPEALRRTVKKAVKADDAVFITNEFLSSNEYGLLYKDIFKDSEAYLDDNGRTLGEYSVYKDTPIAVIPLEAEQAKQFIYSYFNPVGNSYGFDFYKTAVIKVASQDIVNIEQTICEYLIGENPTVTVKLNDMYSEVSVTTFGTSREEATELLEKTTTELTLLLGDDVFSLDEPCIEKVVVNLLLERNLKIATAESCTGGMMSEMITAVPNSSAVFEIGLTSYSNRIKQYALSVPKETLINYGAVSKQTAAAMALGVKNLSGADFGIGITGVAGPSSSEGKPVGTVYIALCDGTHYWVRKLSLSPFYTRDEIRRCACFTAFDLSRRYIECLPALLPEYSEDTENINCLYEQPHYINSSLLFMKENLSKYLSNQEAFDETETTEPVSETPFAFGTTTSSPLDNLRKKVIKKHRVKYKFTIPDFKAMFKDFVNRLYTTADIKGFLMNYFYKTATLILTCAVIMISVLAIDIFAKDTENSKVIANMRSLWTNADFKNIDGIYYDFAELQQLNPQISGWITIDGTEINNPVCTYRKSNYYNSHNVLNKSSDYGSLYFGNNTDLTGSAYNTVIYGNSPKDGSMFADLINYKDSKFAKNKQIIELTTLFSKNEYQVFAIITATDNPSHDYENEYFNYEKTDFTSESEFNLWLSEARLRSLYDCMLPIEYGDNLLTLVTDTDEFSSAKLVIIAKKIESEQENISYPLKVNSAPKFPSIWYKIHNLEDPYTYYSTELYYNY